jgi:flagellum-specific peptidoglycan hydrolase FlgJ
MRTLSLICLFCLFIYGYTNHKLEIPKKIKDYENTNEQLATELVSNKHKINKHHYSDFCNKYYKITSKHQVEYGIPISIQFAQAIAESGCGKSDLAKVTNNLFGMKYYKEIFDGDYYQSKSGEKWRKYNSFEESFEDHALFLKRFYPNSVGKDWKHWVTNCKGYGAGSYWTHIGKIIEEYKLYNYDEIVKNTINLNKTYQI